MRLRLAEDQSASAVCIADLIKRRILSARPTEDAPFVLALPVSPTAKLIYALLVKFHTAGELSFRHVIAFVIDEYVGLAREHRSSQYTYMHHHFFSRVDIEPAAVHLLDGNAADLGAECLRFEAAIAAVGGLDLCLVCPGGDGAVGCNEPGSSLQSRTRVKSLAYETTLRLEKSGAFARTRGDDHFSGVPRRCLTMGIGTIADAHQIIVFFNGRQLASCLQRALEGAVSHMCPVSAFQQRTQESELPE